MNKWIAEFELEDSDTMPEHMDLEYKGAKIDFHCRPMWIPVSERLPEEGEEVLVTGYDTYKMIRGEEMKDKPCTICGSFSWVVNGNDVARALNRNAEILEKLIARVDDLEKLKDQKAATGEGKK